MRPFGWLTLSAVPLPLRLACFGALGALVGLGLYVARISEAVSYLSDNPRTCINCHVMTPQYASWQHSSHAGVAVCNDCHVPQDNILHKYFFKAKDGLRHSTMFTFRLEPQVIRATPDAREVIQSNCLRCHERVVEDIGAPLHSDFKRACVDCHREVPHGRVHSLSSAPNARVPELDPVTPAWLRGATEPTGIPP